MRKDVEAGAAGNVDGGCGWRRIGCVGVVVVDDADGRAWRKRQTRALLLIG